MLDTNIASYIVRGHAKPQAIALARIGQWGISAIVAGELEVLQRRTGNPSVEEGVLRFLREVEIVPFGADAAFEYGLLRAEAMRQGRDRPVADSLIAAHALAEGAILVTNNQKDFAGIEGLHLDNWLS